MRLPSSSRAFVCSSSHRGRRLNDAGWSLFSRSLVTMLHEQLFQRCITNAARMFNGVALGIAEQRVGSRVKQRANHRSEEHTSELQSLMRISYAVFCLKTKKRN